MRILAQFLLVASVTGIAGQSSRAWAFQVSDTAGRIEIGQDNATVSDFALDGPTSSPLDPEFRRTSFLPTDSVVTETLDEPEGPASGPRMPISDSPRQDFAKLMRPRFAFEGEWLAGASDVELRWYEAKITLPTYPVFGPPPPMLSFGFSYTDVIASSEIDLPNALFDYSLGASWVRKINEKWALRTFSSIVIATDGKNVSSDAWQFRGGLFAMYQRDLEWTWLFGAIALGRNDIPVVPAAGVIWVPHARLKYDLVLPKPQIAWLLSDDSTRQQWLFVGGGLDGGTWGYETSAGRDSQLTYRDWRAVIGWESVPSVEPGVRFAPGRTMRIETGYVFGRKFEFDGDMPSLELKNTLMLRVALSF